jgi:hypothetical protein
MTYSGSGDFADYGTATLDASLTLSGTFYNFGSSRV